MSIVVIPPSAESNSAENGQAGIIAPSGIGWSPGGVGLSANTAYLARFVPAKSRTITKLAFVVSAAASADDACSVAIYDSSLTRLAVSATTLGKLNTVGIKTVDLTSPLNIEAKAVYYAAFSVGAFGGTGATLRFASWASADVPALFGTAAGVCEAFFKGTSHPLPTSIAAPTITSTAPTLALREA